MVVEILEPFLSAWPASPPFDDYVWTTVRLTYHFHRRDSLPISHHLQSQTHPRFIGCSNVVSFPEERTGMMLPPSLTRINLLQFENLEFMFSEGFQDLASLQELKIYKCPKLKSLPKKDVLRSLGYLYISSCPLLKEECSSDKGREWSKISHIPRVGID
ncbi:hypothetical protein Gotur_024861, partial [Gossypium turneri]